MNDGLENDMGPTGCITSPTDSVETLRVNNEPWRAILLTSIQLPSAIIKPLVSAMLKRQAPKRMSVNHAGSHKVKEKRRARVQNFRHKLNTTTLGDFHDFIEEIGGVRLLPIHLDRIGRLKFTRLSHCLRVAGYPCINTLESVLRNFEPKNKERITKDEKTKIRRRKTP